MTENPATENTQDVSDAQAEAIKAQVRRKRRRQLAVAAVLAFIALGWWMYQRSIHVSTDDARIASDLILISSKVAGRIETLAVKEGSALVRGDLIAQLDSAETRFLLEELKAQLKAMEATIAQGVAEITMVERQTSGAQQAVQSQLTASQANLASTDADLQLKSAEFKRSESLRERGILSQQGWEQARSAFLVAQQSQNRARAQVASAQAHLVEANANRDRLAVLEQQQTRLSHERDRVQHHLSRQQVILDERRITAPQAGLIDQTFVNGGEYLLPGQRIALLHDPSDVWVKANIKETEIRHLKVGQPVDISVDAYPGSTFTGEVVRIGHAATSQFALLPSTNPSGNFTKVTQRLPVKIAVHKPDQMLKPGMMVEVSIDIRQE
jgi:membrane fusion protein (multidrug efflux system)